MLKITYNFTNQSNRNDSQSPSFKWNPKLIWWLPYAAVTMVFSAELPVSLYAGSFIVHTWFLTLSLEGFLPCPICPNSHPSSVSCLAPAREDEEHFKFNAVQRVGLYIQHSPGTDLQELGQWCQRLEILQQAKVWRAFLCSREFFFLF